MEPFKNNNCARLIVIVTIAWEIRFKHLVNA